MNDLSVRIATDDEQVRTRLSWLLEFLDVRSPTDSGELVFLADDTRQQPEEVAGERTPVILLRTSSMKQPPTTAANVVSEVSWPPLQGELERALHAGLSFLKQLSRTEPVQCPALKRLVGISDGIVDARALIAKVSNSDATVLITGESGTGKEVVARALHDCSHRHDGPFVPVNCGAIPAELLESELFGHEKGAFTGAFAAKVGRFELASGGTLFLDEIGDMPLAMQVKVLRALQDKAFERVGGVETRHADVRILAATHRDLQEMIAAGTFREDLYYRLNVFPIEMEPLRARPEDLPLLVQAIAEKIRAEQGIKVRLTVDALQILARYPWPGNVRELANLLERLAIQFPNELVASDNLPARYAGGNANAGSREAATHQTPVAKADSSQESIELIDEPVGPVARLPVNGLDLKNYLARLECSLIEQALEDTNSVVARAADRLHIRRTTLVEKMRKYGIERA